MNPLISIIIPTFNRESLLKETLDSVSIQSYEQWECIVVDDGSIDGTAAVVKVYILRDNRFKYYQRTEHRRKGAAACRNYGLELAKGELIQFLDDDDLLGKSKLTEQLKFYDDPLSVITCKWGWFSEIDDLESRFKNNYNCYRDYNKPWAILRTFGLHNEYLPIHNYLIPKSLINKAGLWEENLGNNDDAEFMTRIILQSSGIRFASKAKVYYRTGNDGKLSDFDAANKLEAAISSWKLIDQHIKERFKLKDSIYVLNAKMNLGRIAKKKYLPIYEKELEFFELNPWTFSLLKTLNRLGF